MLSWCKDYLYHRKQCVKIENVKSDEKDMHYGVPQGSILGPLFFIIYVNDLLKIINSKVQILLYADDTVLYYADHDPKAACITVEHALTDVYNWCDINKLTINIKKTKHMFVTPRTLNMGVNYHIKMGQVTLDNVTSYNYLGVIIDNKLTFNDFLKDKCDKINNRLYQLIKMRKSITSNIACIIYKQVIIPLLDYADFLIDSGPAYLLRRIENLHEKALRLIDCKTHKKADVHGLETMYRIDPPKKRRYNHHCAIMYRLSRQGGGLDKYRPPIRLRSRNKIKFKQNRRVLEGILKSPLTRGIKLWNMIPESIQRSVTKVKFKAKIKDIIF